MVVETQPSGIRGDDGMGELPNDRGWEALQEAQVRIRGLTKPRPCR